MGANGSGHIPHSVQKVGLQNKRELLGKLDKIHREAAPLAMLGAWLPLLLELGGLPALPALPASSLFSLCLEVRKQIYSLLCLD